MRNRVTRSFSILIELLDELKDIGKRLGITLNLSEEVNHGLKLRIAQLKAKFVFKDK